MGAEWIVSSTVLLIAVITLRAVLGRKLHAEFRYGIWLLVLLRLLVPVTFGTSVLSWENLRNEPAQVQTDEVTEREEATGKGTAILPVEPTQDTVTKTWRITPAFCWKVGMAAVALWMLGCNLAFSYRLRRSRKLLQRQGRTAVYVADTPSPCLFGLFRPAVYLTEAAAEQEAVRTQVIRHEMTHLRHGDHIWALLRTLCVILWWFHPLVWVAAYLSRTDAELACDSAVLRQMEPSERIAYGKTILTLAAAPGALPGTAATLSRSGRQIRSRIRAIAAGHSARLWAMVVAVVLALLAVGCTFTGGESAQQQPITLPDPPATDQSNTEQPPGPQPAEEVEPEDSLSARYVDLDTLTAPDMEIEQEATVDGSVFRLEDSVDDPLESVAYAFYYWPMTGQLDSYYALAGDEQLRSAIENNTEKIEKGQNYQEVTLHSVRTMPLEEVQRFSDVVQEGIRAELEKYALTDYGIVEVDVSWTLNDAMEATAPQTGDGRWLRYYLVGRDTADGAFLIYDEYWGEFM